MIAYLNFNINVIRLQLNIIIRLMVEYMSHKIEDIHDSNPDTFLFKKKKFFSYLKRKEIYI